MLYDEQQPIVFGQPSFVNSKNSDPRSIRYCGVIKKVDPNTYSGYIYCPDIKKDVLFNKYSIKSNRLPRLSEKVNFSVSVNEDGYYALQMRF